MLIDGGGGVFMVYGLDGGSRYYILAMFCVKVEVGVEDKTDVCVTIWWNRMETNTSQQSTIIWKGGEMFV